MGRRLGSAPRLEIMLGGSSVSVCHGDFCMCHTSSLRGAWPCGMVQAHRALQLSPRPWCHQGVPCNCATITMGAVASKSEGPYGVCDAPYVGRVVGSMESPMCHLERPRTIEGGWRQGVAMAPHPVAVQCPPARTPEITQQHLKALPSFFFIYSFSHITLFFHFLHITF